MSHTTGTPGTMTGTGVVDFLERQHQEIKSLFANVQAAAPDKRKEPFDCLVRLLAVHETAEEEVVHPSVKREPGGEAQVEARLEEERQAKITLHDLEAMDVTTPEFLTEIERFKQAVVDHAEHEEHDEFPILAGTQDPERLEKLRKMVERAEAMAPTHPHPHGPESALGNLAVGPFVAVADRVRDALAK